MSKKSLARVKAKKNGTFRFGSNVFTIKAGKHKAVQLALSEVAVNNLVLRVHLDNLEKDSGDSDRGPPTPVTKTPSTRTSVRSKPGRAPSGKIAESTPRTSVRTRRSDITRDNDNREKANTKMIKNKVEAQKKMGSVKTSIVNSPGKVIKYKFINRSANAKYVLAKSPSKLLDSKADSPTNFNMKVKNTYQAKRKSTADTIRYCLEEPAEKPFEERLLNYKFSKLAVDVRSLRLPAPHWKIKIYMRNKAISSIAFTNKQESERVLKFSSLNDNYEMIIDNKRANLLGSPLTIDTRQDVEILLDVLHNIASDNPMIAYK